MRRFIEDIVSFGEQIVIKKNQGWKAKDLAKMLDLYPSAFSVLTKKVIPDIKRNQDLSKSELSDIFNRHNNLSEKRVRLRIAEWIDILNQLSDDSSREVDNPIIKMFSQSNDRFLAPYFGTYDCYYVSSFGYQAKREPFKIFYDEFSDQVIAVKGNKKSKARYRGIVSLANARMMNIQLVELDTVIPDLFVIHCSLIPYPGDGALVLKCISVSMSNANMPISRKLILKKRMNVLENYEDLSTTFFHGESKYYDESEAMVVEYLSKEQAFLEYLALAHPSFDIFDLPYEQSLRDKMSTRESDFVKPAKHLPL